MGRKAPESVIIRRAGSPLWRRAIPLTAELLELPYQTVYKASKGAPVGIAIIANAVLCGFDFTTNFQVIRRSELPQVQEQRNTAEEAQPVTPGRLPLYLDELPGQEVGVIGSTGPHDVMGTMDGLRGVLTEHGYVVTLNRGLEGIAVADPANPAAWQAVERRFGFTVPESVRDRAWWVEGLSQLNDLREACGLEPVDTWPV